MTDATSRSTPKSPVIRGTILGESLKPGTVLKDLDMRIIGVSRYRVTEVADYQPEVWTAIEFEAPERIAASLADQLATALLEPGWYVNWNSDTEATVVFPGKIYSYRHGDAAVRAAAEQHGRQCGVPESQLDWTDEKVIAS